MIKRLFRDKIFLAALFVFLSSAYVAVYALEGRWEKQNIVCNPNENEMREFFKLEGLLPLMAGIGHTLNTDLTRDEKVVTYILQDPDGKIAIIQYFENRACMIAVADNVTTDGERLMKWLGIE